jgi:hypothetical protein
LSCASEDKRKQTKKHEYWQPQQHDPNYCLPRQPTPEDRNDRHKCRCGKSASNERESILAVVAAPQRNAAPHRPDARIQSSADGEPRPSLCSRFGHDVCSGLSPSRPIIRPLHQPGQTVQVSESMMPSLFTNNVRTAGALVSKPNTSIQTHGDVEWDAASGSFLFKEHRSICQLTHAC